MYNAFEMLHRTSVYAPPIPGEPEKYKLAMRMLHFPNGGNLSPEPWMPRKLASYRTFNIDLQNAFDNFGSLFDSIAGYDNAFSDVIEGFENDPYGPRVKVREELISHLGSRVTLVTDYDVPITTKSERFLFAIEVKDQAAVEGGDRQVHELRPQRQGRRVRRQEDLGGAAGTGRSARAADRPRIERRGPRRREPRRKTTP